MKGLKSPKQLKIIMGEESARTDNIFKKIEDYITGGIQRFVAFLFFILAIGAFYGYLIAKKDSDLQMYLLLAPAIIGIVAYYSRAIAIWVFVILLLLIFL